MTDKEVKKITDEEVKAIKENSEKLKSANIEAEKVLSARKIAELENQNYVFFLFNKYGLKLGQDKIYIDGTIERLPVDPTPPVEETTKPETTKPETAPAKRAKKDNKDG